VSKAWRSSGRVPVEALGIELEEDVDRVAGSFGNLGGVYTSVQPEGHAGVP
jgi:hypothetical protein